MPPFDDPDGFENGAVCPECVQSGAEEEIRNHLKETHGWREQKVDRHFGSDPSADELTRVEGPSIPTSDSEITPSYDANERTINESQLTGEKSKDVDTIDELCGCDPEYTETEVIQESKGGTLGPVSANHGSGTPILVCKKCGHWTEAKNSSEDSNSGIGGFGLPD